MHILVYRWDIFPYDDIINELNKQGHVTDVLAFPITNHIKDNNFEEKLAEYIISNSYDAVFSVNYFTTISNVCHKYNINYISWTCDAPLLSMRNPSVNNPENTIYVFDKKEYEYFKSIGTDTVHYLPLAGTPKHIGRLLDADKDYLYDISFVGNLYDKNRYDEMVSVFPDYLCGYMDAAIEAQLNISGGNIINLMLTDDIMNDIEKYTNLKVHDGSDIDIKLHFATSVLSYKAASLIRTQSLNSLSRIADVHLFTTSDTSNLLGVNIHPPVKYQDEMPLVFSASKINLNMTIPNIENGISLRVFDILSAGGFLLTDYRPELEELFAINQDIVVYDGIDDMLCKADYYLKHNEERELIAANGFNKLQKLHTYKHRIEQIFI